MTLNLSAARLYLVNKFPYFATPLYSLIPVETPKEYFPQGIPTMAVDKYYRLYYSEELDWDVRTCASVMYHELNHLLRDHCEGRGIDFDKDIWNIACDAAINDDIDKKDGWTLPKFAVYPSTFKLEDHKLEEWYYAQLIKDADKIKEMIGIGQPTAGQCGSGATGEKGGDYELPADGPAAKAAEKEGIGKVSRAEHEVIKGKVAEDIKSHKGRGTVPGDWDRWADEILNPKIPWQKVLRARVYNTLADVAGRVNYSYRKPSRRASAVPDIVLPTMMQPHIRVAVVVDTSGSMGTDDLAEAIAEVGGILKATGVSEGCTVLSVDAEVHKCEKVFNAKQIKLMGGGGTDMGRGIQAAETLRPKPNIAVVLTDGITPWPQYPPKNIKVIIGIVGKSASPTPDWATVVRIDD